MKFLSALFVLFFAVILLSCQSGVSAPEPEDYNKLQGLVTQIEAQMQALTTELEQITFDSVFDSFPMFSPDGKRIVWASNRNNGGTHDTNLFMAEWVD